MSGIEVAIDIEATPAQVWAVVEDVGRHVEWMDDAVAIHFTSPHRQGPGTTFDCDTKVGPLRLTDKMEITEWSPGRTMGVRHVGLVTGSGRFTLTARADGTTTFAWAEHLTFPWWLGGPVGAAVGGIALKAVWRRNLTNLKRLVEDGGTR